MNSPRDLPVESTSIETTLPISYRHRAVAKPKLLALFLHGYADNGGSLIRRLYGDAWPASFDNVAVLSPNAPFPVPVKTESGWREAYAWYFLDEREQKMLITPEAATKTCIKLINDHGYDDTPKVIVAFSQGGYLAPQLAPLLKNVKEIVGVATGYREDYYPKTPKFKVSAIHGSSDPIFPVAKAHEAHSRILAMGYEGSFTDIAGLAHITSPEVGKAAEEHIKSWL
ncbi:dienelactone hydrolase family protein [soil metagenome]